MNDKKAEYLAEKHMQTIKIPSTMVPYTKNLVMSMMKHPAFNNQSYPWSLDDFEIGKRLGRGKFGRVFLAREKRTGFIVAIKTLLKREIVLGRVEKQVLREVEIQTHLSHPNILQLLTYFHDTHRIYYVLEYAGKGELYKHLRNSTGGRFNEYKSAKYTYQVADALDYCHQNHVIHRDIKPENLLLTITNDVKIADFGWSVHSPSLHGKTMCGTTDYLPPEMVEGKSYKYYVDNWCLGVLLYEFLTGAPPFETKTQEGTFKKIKMLDFEYPPYVTEGAKDVISKLLVIPSHMRLSLKDVMMHPWIQTNKQNSR